MFNIMKDVINNGNFELSKILSKIDKQWAEDKLTDEERAELIGAAQGKANVKNSIDVYDLLIKLDSRVKVLEDKVAKYETNEDTETEDTTTEVTYPEFVVGKIYKQGDMITYDGLVYMCTAPEGQVCVWNPTDYPPYWELA